MTVPKIVVDLVARFNLHIDAYKSPSYNETQIRREFIDPFWKALGWDIDNEQGYAEAYKDVVHEDAIKISGSTKAPDYAFRTGGVRKFFLEAKKPSVNIKDDVSPAYQLRRYAWSAKLPLSVLTDFEELAIYDCRVKPEKNDKASTARIAFYTFNQYAEKWNEIAGIFSREAIYKGSFDKYADDNKRKHGTAEVDDAFLGEIENWRELLAKNIALRNPSLSVRELNTAVQRTIDRIIFLRIAEDRGIEAYGQLQTLRTGKETYKRLATFFERADARYNSGLFHFSNDAGSAETLDTFTLKLGIDDNVLREIFKNLYYPDSPYEFSVMPADILGQVYEQFLGKVIRLSGKRAIIEEKPEIKKAGGVYYTPTFVVKYIVDNTLGAYLKSKTLAQVAGTDKRIKNAAPLRIVDPACGSGSFLIEVYQHLLDWHLQKYVEDGPETYAKGKEPRIYLAAKNAWRLTISERRRILLTHIFGVDIDPQAVEVTKLSLLLKVLEGESADQLARQMDLFHMRALPDLVANVRCGNSLVTPDFYKSFSIDLFDVDDQIKINAFDWKKNFPFLSKGLGFTIVVGNPPYLYSAGAEFIDYFREKYKFSEYQTDFYVYFIEAALSILAKGGTLGFIIPDSWVNSDNFSRMRKAILSTWRVERVCTFSFKVFKKANIENTILLISNDAPSKSFPVFNFTSPKDIVLINELSVDDASRIGIIDPFYSTEGEKIIEKLDRFEKLGSSFDLNRGLHAYRTDGYGQSAFGPGPQTKRDQLERPYHSDTKKNKTFLPEIRGRDVLWLTYGFSGEYISYGTWLAEPRDARFMLSPKLVCRKTLGNILSLALVEEPAAIDQSLYIVLSRDNDTDRLKFVLGILGSSLGAWYLRTKYSIYDKLHPWYTKKQLEMFPLPKFDKQVVKTVDRLMKIVEESALAKIEADRTRLATEKAILIDRLDDEVATIFMLTGSEMQFIRRAVARD